MEEIDDHVEPLDDDNESLAENVAAALKTANSSKSVETRLKALEEAEDLLLNRASGHLLDNFLDEMLEFINAKDARIKCFAITFIEHACKRDMDVIKKTIGILTLSDSKESNVLVIKRIIAATANLYPLILKWVAGLSRDAEGARFWEAFSILKGRIMQKMDSDNEGLRTMSMKFLESVVLSQSHKVEQSEAGRGDLMDLNEVPKDHRFISYRKMHTEATHNLQSLLDEMALSHISAQNLMVAISIVGTIARQRPEYISTILTAIETLNGNLPPTLGTSQVKSVRKDLKIQLLRMHKHPSIHGNKSYHPRVVTILTDLGVTASELSKNLSGVKKRKADEVASSSKRHKTDERAKDDDEDDEEYTAETFKVEEPSVESSKQTAIDITTDFIYERLTHSVAMNLVIISLMTLPDKMPASLASSYTPIAAAGTEGQRRHLARILAIQCSAVDVGPGVEQLKQEKLKKISERSAARQEGQIIPPTPMSAHGASMPKKAPKQEFKLPTIPVGPKVKQQFDIVTATRPLSKDDARELFTMAFKRIMDAERRAIQGGVQQLHNILLIRLATRYQQEGTKYEEMLTDFIAQDHRQRTDLALLWLAELYAQYQGFSICYDHRENEGKTSRQEKLDHYNRVMCGMLQHFHKNGLIKEVIYYKLILDSPLVTSQALEWLKYACIDPTYGSYGMTAVRELIMTRNRQRKELLKLLFELGFYDLENTELIPPERIAGLQKIRQACVETVREFCEVPFLKNDLRKELVEMIERCADEKPPAWFIPLKQNGNEEWTDNCIRCALAIYLSVLPTDPSLLIPLALVYAKAPRLFKTEVLRSIDQTVRAIGMHDEHMLALIEDCPAGAETLLARIVFILTEREPATKNLVHCFIKLYEERQIDPRSLIPILNSMDKPDILELLPKFLLVPHSAKVLEAVNKKLLNGKKNEEPLFTPSDLLWQYHQLEPADENEMSCLIESTKCLMDGLTKDAIAASIERLMEQDPPPTLFYATLGLVYQKHPSLDGFLSNVTLKLVTRKSWRDDPVTKAAMYKAMGQLRGAAYAAILTTFSVDEFNDYLDFHGEEQATFFKKQMQDFLPSMSTQQRNSIDMEVRNLVDDPRDRERREKRERRERERRKEKDREDEERRRERRDRR